MDAEYLQLLLRFAHTPARDRQKAIKAPSLAAALRHISQLADLDFPEWRRCQQWLTQPQCQLLDWFHPDYPETLRHIGSPPLLLFLQGDASLLQQPQVALVGSRNASPVGLHSASHFASGLAAAGLVVSSGLASGIDAAAHRAALQQGRTLAVLGTGIDQVYPRQHRQLQQQIAQAGLLVSEFSPGSQARREHFPRRNRILSGLSLGVLVVEAKTHSGSLNTARLAIDQNKYLWALPGSIWDPAQAGCLQLLRAGALLATSPNDVLHDLGYRTLAAATEEGQNNSSECLANQALLANVDLEVTSLDTIVARSGLPIRVVTEQLVLLELAGRVTSVAGGYIRMGRR